MHLTIRATTLTATKAATKTYYFYQKQHHIRIGMYNQHRCHVDNVFIHPKYSTFPQ